MTLVDAVAAYFRAHPGQWIDGRQLADIGGAYAWRSRVSDARTKLKMHIENRQRTVGQWTVSEYRYVPPPPKTVSDAVQEQFLYD